MNQRRTELVVYRTSGAGKRLLRRTLWSEFAFAGRDGGVVAALRSRDSPVAVADPRVLIFRGSRSVRCGSAAAGGGFLPSLCGSVLGIRLLGDSQQYRRLQS